MIEVFLPVLATVALVAASLWIFWKKINKISDDSFKAFPKEIPPALTREQDAIVREMLAVVQLLTKQVNAVPAKVLNTIQGSANTTSGKMGEIMSRFQVQAEYDRFILLDNVVDFIGIKFPVEEGGNLVISFIDAKSGKAVLTAEQKAMKSLIDQGKCKVNFKVVRTVVD